MHINEVTGHTFLTGGDTFEGRILADHECVNLSMHEYREREIAMKAVRKAEHEAWLDEDDTVYSDEAVDVEAL